MARGKRNKFFGSKETEEASKPGESAESQDGATETDGSDEQICSDETVKPVTPNEVPTETVPGKYRKFQ